LGGDFIVVSVCPQRGGGKRGGAPTGGSGKPLGETRKKKISFKKTVEFRPQPPGKPRGKPAGSKKDGAKAKRFGERGAITPVPHLLHN